MTARALHRGRRLASRTIADLWRRRRWTVPASVLVMGLAILAMVPALSALSGALWTAALLGVMGFGAAYTTARLHAISRTSRIATEALREADARATRRAAHADRTIADLARMTQRLSEEKATLEARLEALQQTSLERYEALVEALEQARATASTAEGRVAALDERIEEAALVAARIGDDVERLRADQVVLGTRVDAHGGRLDQAGAKGTKHATDLVRIRERVVAGERQIGRLRYPDAPRVVVFFGHHKCASRFFRFEIFFQIAEMTGSRLRRYVIEQPPFHYSRMDDLDLSNMDFSDLGGAARDVLLFANATDRSLDVVRRSATDWAGVRVIRDPRQVFVSDYFHHRGDHPVEPDWVWDRLVEDQPILRSLPIEDGLLYELDHISREVIETQVMATMDDPRILTFKIEDFAAAPADHLARMAEFLRVPDIAGIDLSRTFANPDSEPWQRHFTPGLRAVFKERYGQALIDLGYERDLAW